MNIETITIHDWKKHWQQKPYMATNDLFLEWQFCVMNQKMIRCKGANEGVKILKDLDKMCIEFSKWQEFYYMDYRVSELAECIGETAFRVYVATRDKTTSMHRIWDLLGWEKDDEETRHAE